MASTETTTEEDDTIRGYSVSLFDIGATAIIEADDEADAAEIAANLETTADLTIEGVPVTLEVYESAVEEEVYTVTPGDVVRRNPRSDTESHLVKITSISRDDDPAPSEVTGTVIHARESASVEEGETVTFSPGEAFEHVERT